MQIAAGEEHGDMMLEVDAFELLLKGVSATIRKLTASMGRSIEDCKGRMAEGWAGQVYLIVWQWIRASFVGMIASSILEFVVKDAGGNGGRIHVPEKAA